MSKETADSVDIDGFLVYRQIPVQAEAISARRKYGVAMYDQQLTIPQIQRGIESGKIRSLKKAISFFFHSKRGVRKGVIERLNQRDTDKFGNTGRPNKQQWVEMTWQQLNSSELTGLQDIFFTPKGIKTVLSKGAGIQELLTKYEHVTHFDDDPLTVLLLARHFKDVDFVLVEDLSAGYLLNGVDWKEYKNVRRVSRVQDL